MRQRKDGASLIAEGLYAPCYGCGRPTRSLKHGKPCCGEGPWDVRNDTPLDGETAPQCVVCGALLRSFFCTGDATHPVNPPTCLSCHVGRSVMVTCRHPYHARTYKQTVPKAHTIPVMVDLTASRGGWLYVHTCCSVCAAKHKTLPVSEYLSKHGGAYGRIASLELHSNDPWSEHFSSPTVSLWRPASGAAGVGARCLFCPVAFRELTLHRGEARTARVVLVCRRAIPFIDCDEVKYRFIDGGVLHRGVFSVIRARAMMLALAADKPEDRWREFVTSVGWVRVSIAGVDGEGAHILATRFHSDAQDSGPLDKWFAQ